MMKNSALIGEAMRFSTADHLLIRICMTSESANPDKKRVLREPLAGQPYDVSILKKWARKLLEDRGRKAIFSRLPVGHYLADQCFRFGLRLLEYLGSWGTPVAFLAAGLLGGLAFLPKRIFTSPEVTMMQILLPVFLGSAFILWQVVHILFHLSSKIGNHKVAACKAVHKYDALASDAPSDETSSSCFLQTIRRTMGPYIRWNLNLSWCLFWLVTLVTMGGEYVRHQPTDPDYVYHSPYNSMDDRLKWIGRVSNVLPNHFKLSADAVAWSDRVYRERGYKLTPTDLTGQQSAKSARIGLYVLEPETRSLPPNSFKRLEEPPRYAASCFWFLFGVILVYGFMPRVVALPIFGLLLCRNTLDLFQELHREPYASLLDQLNMRSQKFIQPEGDEIHGQPLPPAEPNTAPSKRPQKDILVIPFKVGVSPNDALRYGSQEVCELLPQCGGDTASKQQVLNLVDKYELGGRLIVVTRLSMSPDRPFIRFLQDLSKTGRVCELDFADMWPGAKTIAWNPQVRLGVWQKAMVDAGLKEAMPYLPENKGATK